jgi:hypothetical protein
MKICKRLTFWLFVIATAGLWILIESFQYCRNKIRARQPKRV